MVAVVGLVRFAPELGEVAANAARILRHAEAAAQLGASVVAFPLSAVSGAVPGAPSGPPGGGLADQAHDAVARLARDSLRHALGGRYLLVGVHAWDADGKPQLSAALLHQGKVGLSYAAGLPDPLAAPWEGAHRVEGELAERGAHLGAVFQAHGRRFGVELAGAGVEPSWPRAPGGGPDAALDAVLRLERGGALAADQAGRRLSPRQPGHEGLTLWHTVD